MVGTVAAAVEANDVWGGKMCDRDSNNAGIATDFFREHYLEYDFDD